MSHTGKKRDARQLLTDALRLAGEQAQQEKRDGYALCDKGHAFGTLTHDKHGRVRDYSVVVNARSNREPGCEINLGYGWQRLSSVQMVRMAKALLAGSVGIWDVHVDDMGIMDALRKAESAHGATKAHRQLQASSGLQALDAEFEEDD